MMGVVQGGTGGDAAMWNGQQVAGKTGTSEDYKDISFVGITPHIAAGIWVGDPTNETSVNAGSCGDVFSWYASALMDAEGIPVEDFPQFGDPPYSVYDDASHQIMSEETYQKKKAEEERKKKEEEAKRKAEAEAAARRKAEEGAAAAQRRAEEEAARRAAEEAAKSSGAASR